MTEKPEDQRAAWCQLMISKVAASALQLEADDATYDTIIAWLRAEFDPCNRWTEIMTRLACVTQRTDDFRELGPKIRALADVAMEVAEQVMIEQQTGQTFLQAILAALSREVHKQVEDPPRPARRRCWNCQMIGHISYNCPQPPHRVPEEGEIHTGGPLERR